MKRNGFTLVELLAVVVILGIVGGVAVPSVMGVMNKNRIKNYKTDASRLVHSAKSEYEKDTTIEEPDDSSCVLLSINDLESSSLSGPNGGKYQNSYSYATINKDNYGNFIYGVQILEDYTDSSGKKTKKGIKYTTNINLKSFNFDSLEVVDDPREFISIDSLKTSSKYSNCRTIINNRASSNMTEKKENTVTYDYRANGGTSADKKEVLVAYNDPVNLTYKAVKEGYEFVGWSTNKNSYVPLSTYFMSDDDITLYAIFKKNLETTFHFYTTDGVATVKEACTIYNNRKSCSYDLPEEVTKSTGPNGTGFKGVSTKEDSLENEEEYTSDNKDYYAFYDGIFNVKYVPDAHSRNISTLEDNCHVSSIFKDGVYTIPECVKTLPTYKVDSKFNKYGFIDANDGKLVGKEGEKITLNKISTTLVASSQDMIKPVDVKINNSKSTDGGRSYVVSLLFSDNESSLSDNVSYKWGLSSSKTVEPQTYYDDSFSTGGAKSVERSITLSKLTGSYYLWIKPISYKDSYQNSNTQIVISSSPYNLSNNGSIGVKVEPRNISFRVENKFSFTTTFSINGLTGEPILNSSLLNNVKIGIRNDNSVNIVNNTIVNLSSFSKDTDSFDLTFTVPETNEYDGLITMIFPEGLFTDSYGNKTLAASINTSVEVTKNSYSLNFVLGGNSNEYIENKNNSSYSPDDDPFKLKNPSRLGYKFTGWTGGFLKELTKDVLVPTGTTGDLEFTAHWEPITYPINYDLTGGSLGTNITNPSSYTIEDTFTLNNPSKKYYDFAGWSGTGLKNNTIYVTIPKGSIGERSYTANYKPIEYSIKLNLYDGHIYDSNNNVIDNSLTYNHFEDFTLPHPIKRIGNVYAEFNGWTDNNGAFSHDVTIKKDTSVGEKEFSAHYREGAISVKSGTVNKNGGIINIDLILNVKNLDICHFDSSIYNTDVYIGNTKADNRVITFNENGDDKELIIKITNASSMTGDVTLNIKNDAFSDGNHNTTLPATLSVGHIN